MDTGELTRQTRQKQNLTQAEFGENLGALVPGGAMKFHYSTISRWENNDERTKPAYANFILISQFGPGWQQDYARQMLHLMKPDFHTWPGNGNGTA